MKMIYTPALGKLEFLWTNMTYNQIDILKAAAQSIFDKKGFNILILDVRESSSMTDYFIIAEGTVERHVNALSTASQKALEEFQQKPFRVEGERTGEWVVVDYGDIVIHLFTPEMRERYALEEVWKDSTIVDVEIDTQPKNISKDRGYSWERKELL